MKKLTIRLSDELSERIAELARKEQRSVNRQVIWLIEQAVKVEREKEGARQEIAHDIAHIDDL